MTSDRCFEEEDLLALLAGDESPEVWREHMRGCAECRDLFSAQEPLRHALEEPGRQPIDSLVKRARAHLEEALRLGPKPIAYYDAWPDTPVGPLLLAASDRGLCAISFGSSLDNFLRRVERRGFRPARSPEPVRQVVQQLREYFAGRRRRFDVTVDLAGQTPFQRQVLEAAARVPAGSVASYGDIARAIGRPTAPRAVGAALGQNPVPIVVPCHRIIGSDGGLHGYGGGLDVKEKLLRLEGAPI
jgi:methylated-DNA-[protein]-cysteine S-methyltransferase